MTERDGAFLGPHPIAAHVLRWLACGVLLLTGLLAAAMAAPSPVRPTATTLSGPDGVVVFGAPAMLTATVAANGVQPTGSVDFRHNGQLLRRVPLDGVVARFDLSRLPVGTYAITASYPGDAQTAPSTSNGWYRSIQRAATAVVLAGGADYVAPDSPVTLTATVSVLAPSHAKPVGLVTFRDGGTTLGSVTVVNGKASFDTVAGTGWHDYSAGFTGEDFMASYGYRVVNAIYPTGPQRLAEPVAGDQTDPAAAALADGAVVVYLSAAGPDGPAVLAQRFDGAGAPVGSPVTVAPAAKGNTEPAATGLAFGGFAVAWTRRGPGNKPEVVGRLFAADGSAAAAAFKLTERLTRDQVRPRLAPLQDGGFVAAWADGAIDGNGWGIAARMFGSGGAPKGTTFAVNADATGDQTLPAVATLDNGTFAIAWAGADDIPAVQRFRASGARLGSVTPVSMVYDPTRIRNLEVVSAPLNQFMVVFEQLWGFGPWPYMSYQRFRSNGALQGRQEAVSFSDLQDTTVVRLADGAFAFLYATPDGFGDGIAGSFLADITDYPDSQFRVSVTGDRRELRPTGAALANGLWLAAWEVDSAADGRNVATVVLRGP